MFHDLRKSNASVHPPSAFAGEKSGARGLRRGFTLVELLVVIAIIAVLASLSAWAVWAMMGRRQVRNTEATIKTVNKILQSHWRYVIDEAKKDTISPAVLTMAAPDPTGERARVLWIKFRLMEAFPQSFQEIASPFVYTNDPYGNGPYIPPNQSRYIVKYQTALANLNAANNNPSTQSAACLLIALSISRGGNNALSPDQLTFAVADTDNDGISELVDAWGNPMAFFRFPSNNPDLQLANPATPGSRSAKFCDPIDTGGTLISNNWYGSANSNTFVNNFHPTLTATGIAYFVTPVIVSAGPNGIMDLGPDLSVVGPGALDNIFSFKLQLD